MLQTTLKQLRRDTGQVIRTIQRGEHVIVTDHGKPVAQLTPIAPKPRTQDAELFGIWKAPEASTSVKDYMDKVRKGRFA